jgi:hypothetical protein
MLMASILKDEMLQAIAAAILNRLFAERVELQDGCVSWLQGEMEI